MSTSAVDHLKLVKAKENLVDAENLRAQAEDEEDYCRERLEQAQRDLLEAERDVLEAEQNKDTCLTAETAAKNELVEAEEIANKVVSEDNTAAELDPMTGLPIGEKIAIDAGGQNYVTKILQARNAMENDDIETALELEQEALTSETITNARLVGLPSATQVDATTFCTPKHHVSDEILSKTFDYVKNNQHDSELSLDSAARNSMMDLLLNTSQIRSGYPKSVSKQVIQMIQSQRMKLLEMEFQDKEDTEENMEAFRIATSSSLEMTNAEWESVEIAVRNTVTQQRQKYPKELELPRESSAPIARYNQSPHFRFESDQARCSVNALDDALATCSLRRRPKALYCSEIDRCPFEYPMTSNLDGFDLDGDMVAICGDKAYDSVRISKNHLAFAMVPCPVNPEDATDMSHLKDYRSGDDAPWDMIPRNVLQGSKGKNKEWFSDCAADHLHERVWAASSGTGTIHAFSTIKGLKRGDRRVGLLSFDNPEIQAQGNFCNSGYDIVRVADHIVGSAGTNRLSIWKMQDAIDEYPLSREVKKSESGVDDGDEEDSSSNSEEAIQESERKRPRIDPYKGMAPKTIAVGGEEFNTGDIQGLTDTEILIGPSRGGYSGPKSLALRLFDIQAESVVGVYCGSRYEVSIEKQYCVEEFNLIFTSDTSIGLAWDKRDYSPAVVLHTQTHESRILGVPGSSGAFAFTFGSSSECIQCWDLRMPSSHVYTMATGNANIRHLFWHDRTSSLIAAAKTDHIITHGRARGYMYGDDLSWSEEEETHDSTWWPPGAKHEQSYFGTNSFWNLRHNCILQYAFENGKPMAARYLAASK